MDRFSQELPALAASSRPGLRFRRLLFSLLLSVFFSLLPALALSSTPAASSSDGTHDGGTVLVREWQDPCLAHRWRLVQDTEHPGWPRRLIPLDPINREEAGKPSRREPAPALPPSPAAVALIRAGDHVTVEQHSNLLDARFEGVALEPAVAGQPLRVRLGRVGGEGFGKGSVRVVIAVAVAPGKTRWIERSSPGAGLIPAQGRFLP